MDFIWDLFSLQPKLNIIMNKKGQRILLVKLRRQINGILSTTVLMNGLKLIMILSVKMTLKI